MRKFSREWKFSRSPRSPAWADIADEQWDSWRWQLSHRMNRLDELQRWVRLTPEEMAGITGHRFRLDITPYFASLMDPDDPRCPVRQQMIPRGRELAAFTAMMPDSLAEDAHSPVPGLVHRYPDRVLMLVTTQCASYCRYCTRSRIVGDAHAAFSPRDFDAQIDYIRRTPQVRDVLLSGGDPLTLNLNLLDNLLARLREIPHVEVLRIGSRVPVFLPMRVDDALVAVLRKYHPLWLNTHINHPREITPELCAACERLADAGIPLGNQTVLLAGVNDSVHIQRQLAHELVQMRVRPYYLYQCDLVPGAGHFRTPISKGIEIIEGMRGHTSGFAVPQYIVDAPGGGGKVPVNPNYVLSQAPGRVVVRNFEGYISTYTEPTDYDPTLISHLEAEATRRPEPGQSGLTDLLEGHTIAIKPQDFDLIHRRGRQGEHRLSADANKWQPYGIGEESQAAEGNGGEGKSIAGKPQLSGCCE
jgi:lysine 2,3-aminomutase